ncbi:MAG: DUF6036 family nucleotidyltransferase [Acidobacteriota bacterium]
MDRARLFAVFEALDSALESACELEIRGGAAVLALGLEGRTTLDVDVLPASRFVDADLRRACLAIGLDFNPVDGKDLAEREFIEVVPEETLILPVASPDRPYNTVFRGRRLVVRTPPAADLVVGKLKRLQPEDLADVSFLVQRYAVSENDLKEAFDRLPERWRRDLVIADNLRYVLQDL